jgi:hypothetical protein
VESSFGRGVALRLTRDIHSQSHALERGKIADDRGILAGGMNVAL